MKKIVRNRAFRAIISFLVAILAAGAFFITYSRQQSQQTIVLVATSDVQSGETLEAASVMRKTVGTIGLPNNLATKAEDVVGKVYDRDIYAGDYIYLDHIMESRDLEKAQEVNGVLSLKAGESLLTLPIADNATVDLAYLMPGDCIDVYVIRKERRQTESATEEVYVVNKSALLSGIKIYSLSDSSLYDSFTYAPDDETAPFIPEYITLIVNDDQALELLRSQYDTNCSIHFSLPSDGRS